MDYFTGDWHLDHANIIKYCNRPFKSVGEMNSTIIDNINDVVMPNDRIFNVGDVALRANLGALRKRINCKNIFVVPGNHDRVNELKNHFTVLPQCYVYENEGYSIVLCHYAMRVWARSHHGVAHLYGHSHGTLPPIDGLMTFDVGVDCWNYKPLSLNQVKAEMKRLCPLGKTLSGDHHGK